MSENIISVLGGMQNASRPKRRMYDARYVTVYHCGMYLLDTVRFEGVKNICLL